MLVNLPLPWYVVGKASSTSRSLCVLVGVKPLALQTFKNIFCLNYDCLRITDCAERDSRVRGRV